MVCDYGNTKDIHLQLSTGDCRNLIDSSRPRPHGLHATPPQAYAPPTGTGMYGHVRQVMTHMLTLHCSTQGAGDSGLTSRLGPLARDWQGATPAGLDPRQLQRTCTGKSGRR